MKRACFLILKVSAPKELNLHPRNIKEITCVLMAPDGPQAVTRTNLAV